MPWEYNGSLLAMQKWGNKSLRFIYDNNGSPYAVVYNNGSTDTVYYYIKNLQGDVAMIVDQNIGIVAKYTYDALWFYKSPFCVTLSDFT